MSSGSELKAAFVGVLFGLPVAVLSVLLTGVYFAFANGFVAQQLWEWHAVPLGMPQVKWTTFAVAAIGTRVLWTPRVDTKEDDEMPLSKRFAKAMGYVIAPWMGLAIGWWLT
jgi:hypothetical protein